MEIIRKYQHFFFFGTLAIVLFSVAFFTDGTGDSGDSVTHYLFARYAFAHPVNFIDHWAKPVFVLLASPFAQFGFIGIKIFNILISLFTSFFVFRIAEKLKIKNSLFGAFILFAFPLYTISIFSGLTEPLFGLMLMISIWLILNEKLNAALILISFLPFCRSEGLIIVLLTAVYLLIKLKRGKIYLLLCGHVFYSLAGVFHYHDIFWVFSKIPYVGEEKYGHGGWTHFFKQSPYIFGIPLLLILVIGLIRYLIEWKQNKDQKFRSEKLFFVFGSFVAVFLSHVVFWKFGIFGSYGLKRVIVAVLPVAALISLIGFNWVLQAAEKKNKVLGKLIGGCVCIYIVIFPFLPNPAAFNFKSDFSLKNDELAINEAAAWIKEKFPNTKVYADHNYVSLALNIDPFDPSQFQQISSAEKGKEKRALIIWDDWFSEETGSKPDEMKLKYIQNKTFEHYGSKVIVFVKE